MFKLKGKHNLDKIEKALIRGLERADNATAKAIAKRAKENAPVDTTALRESIHTVTDEGSGYEEAIARVKAANPKLRQADKLTEQNNILPERPLIGNEPDQGVHVAEVDVPLNYAPIVHDGHVAVFSGEGPSRFVGARPFLADAVREEESGHEKRLRKVITDLEKI